MENKKNLIRMNEYETQQKIQKSFLNHILFYRDDLENNETEVNLLDDRFFQLSNKDFLNVMYLKDAIDDYMFIKESLHNKEAK